jgi:hypothetical protein
VRRCRVVRVGGVRCRLPHHPSLSFFTARQRVRVRTCAPGCALAGVCVRARAYAGGCAYGGGGGGARVRYVNVAPSVCEGVNLRKLYK